MIAPAKHGSFSLPPAALLVLYLAVALCPLVLAKAQGLPPRPFLDEFSTALAMIGFAMLLMEFVISGRFDTVSGQIGIDLAMRFHQLIARTIAVFLFLHPWLYTLPVRSGRADGWTGATSLGIDGAGMASGWAAWVLLFILVAWALYRREFGYRYEAWRAIHGFGALAIALLGAHHALSVGRYSRDTALASLWIALAVVAVLMMAHVYLVRPLSQKRHPYRVTSVEPVALGTWLLVIEPVRGGSLEYEAGQFVWLTLGRTPFSITEHPFSMSSCPADRPRLEFTVKENGDSTSTIGRVEVGASAYVDGPHGNLVVSGRPGKGLVLIAGGVGLAPIMSILRQARAENETRPIRLIYGNRVASQIMYADELDELCSSLDLEVFHVLAEPPEDWAGAVGQIDKHILDERLPGSGRQEWLYVICGPSAMIDSVENSLEALDVPMRRILSEKFSYD